MFWNGFLPPEGLDPKEGLDPEEGLEICFVLDWLPLQANRQPLHLFLRLMSYKLMGSINMPAIPSSPNSSSETPIGVVELGSCLTLPRAIRGAGLDFFWATTCSVVTIPVFCRFLSSPFGRRARAYGDGWFNHKMRRRCQENKKTHKHLSHTRWSSYVGPARWIHLL